MTRRLLLSLAAALLGFCLPGTAQSTYGTILGNVKDASGAAIKGAKVRLTQTAENATRETETNTEGGYEFTNSEAGP